MRIRIDTARIPAPRRTNASSGPGSERRSNSVRRKAAATNAPAMRPKRVVRLILRTSRARLAAEPTAMTSESCYKAKKRDGAHLGSVRGSHLCVAPGRSDSGMGEGLPGRTVRRPGESRFPDRGRVPHGIVRFPEARPRPRDKLHRAPLEVRRVAGEEGPGRRGDARHRNPRRRPLAEGRSGARRCRRAERPRRIGPRRPRGGCGVDVGAEGGPESGSGATRSLRRNQGNGRTSAGNDSRPIRPRREGRRRVRVRRAGVDGPPWWRIPVHEQSVRLPRTRRLVGRLVSEEDRGSGPPNEIPHASRGPAAAPGRQGGRVQRPSRSGAWGRDDAAAIGRRRAGGGRRRWLSDQQRLPVPWGGSRDCFRDRGGRGGGGRPSRRRHDECESRRLREVPARAERPDGPRTVPTGAAVHEERTALRRLPAHADGDRGTDVHGGREREGAPLRRRPRRGVRRQGTEAQDAPRSPARSSIDVTAEVPTARPMRVIVCIKQVPRAQDLQVDPVTQTLKRVGVPSEINPPDANALEMALRLKDQHAAEVVVLSMGPTSFDESLERAVAMGADRSVLLTDRILGGSDTVPTAYALSETIQKIGGGDLPPFREGTPEASTGHVRPRVAGHPELPPNTNASESRMQEGKGPTPPSAGGGTQGG